VITQSMAKRYKEKPETLDNAIKYQKEIIFKLTNKLDNPVNHLNRKPLSPTTIRKYRSYLNMAKRRLEEHLAFKSREFKVISLQEARRRKRG
jgi:hypothetical protein